MLKTQRDITIIMDKAPNGLSAVSVAVISFQMTKRWFLSP